MKKPQNSASEEEILLQEAKEGNEAAFNRLVKEYEQTVYSFAFKVCRDKEKAIETVQDTFVNVFLKLKQFDGQSKFATWLYSIVTNNCLMKRRKTKLEEASVSFDDGHDDPALVESKIDRDRERGPYEYLQSDELREALDKAILKLPMDYRVVFILRDIEELKTEEVASVLGLSVPAVKSRLRRARMFLRNELHHFSEVR